MKRKKLLTKHKLNIIYRNKYLFKFIFNKTNVKIENWINR